MTIEEAWEPAAYGRGPVGPQGAVMGLTENQRVEAIRALALAVLDSEHSGQSDALGRCEGGCNCTTWADGDRCRRYTATLRRIQELGR